MTESVDSCYVPICLLLITDLWQILANSSLNVQNQPYMNGNLAGARNFTESAMDWQFQNLFQNLQF